MPTKGRTLAQLFSIAGNPYGVPRLKLLAEDELGGFWSAKPDFLRFARAFARALLDAQSSGNPQTFLRGRSSFPLAEFREAFASYLKSVQGLAPDGTKPPFVVRSSADEDNETHSAAGAFHTEVNVSAEQLPDAVTSVVASYFEPASYAQLLLMSHARDPYLPWMFRGRVPELEVIVQQMHPLRPGMDGANAVTEAPLLDLDFLTELRKRLIELRRSWGTRLDTEWVVSTDRGPVSLVGFDHSPSDGRPWITCTAAFGIGSAVRSATTSFTSYQLSETGEEAAASARAHILTCVNVTLESLALLQLRRATSYQQLSEAINLDVEAQKSTVSAWTASSVLVGGRVRIGRVIVGRGADDILRQVGEPDFLLRDPIVGGAILRGNSLDHPAIVLREMGISLMVFDETSLTEIAKAARSAALLVSPGNGIVAVGRKELLHNLAKDQVKPQPAPPNWDLICGDTSAIERNDASPDAIDSLCRYVAYKPMLKPGYDFSSALRWRDAVPILSRFMATDVQGSFRVPRFTSLFTASLSQVHTAATVELESIGLRLAAIRCDEKWFYTLCNIWATRVLQGGAPVNPDTWFRCGLPAVALRIVQTSSDNHETRVAATLLEWNDLDEGDWLRAREKSEYCGLTAWSHAQRVLRQSRDTAINPSTHQAWFDALSTMRQLGQFEAAEFVYRLSSGDEPAAQIRELTEWAVSRQIQSRLVIELDTARDSLRSQTMDDTDSSVCLLAEVADLLLKIRGIPVCMKLTVNLLDGYIELADLLGKTLASRMVLRDRTARSVYREVLSGWLRFIEEFFSTDLTQFDRRNLDWCRRGLEQEPSWEVSLGYNRTWRARALALDEKSNLHQVQNNLHQGTLEIASRSLPLRPSGWLQEIYFLANGFRVRDNTFTSVRPDRAEISLGLTIHETSLVMKRSSWDVQYIEPPSSRHTHAGRVARIAAFEVLLPRLEARFKHLIVRVQPVYFLGDASVDISITSRDGSAITGDLGKALFLELITYFESTYQFSGEPVHYVDDLLEAISRPSWHTRLLDSLSAYRLELDYSGYNPDPQRNRFSVAVTHLCMYRPLFDALDNANPASAEEFMTFAGTYVRTHKLAPSSNEHLTLTFLAALFFPHESYEIVFGQRVTRLPISTAGLKRHLLARTPLVAALFKKWVQHPTLQVLRDLWEYNTWYMVQRCIEDQRLRSEQLQLCVELRLGARAVTALVGYFLDELLETRVAANHPVAQRTAKFVDAYLRKLSAAGTPLRLHPRVHTSLTERCRSGEQLPDLYKSLMKIDVRFAESISLD